MPNSVAYEPEPIRLLSILDEDGELDEDLEPDIPDDDLVELYRKMVFVRAFDERRLRLQRQGRIGTFAPVKGQEAAQLGSVYALRDDDWMVPAFRETAAALWRGMKPEDDLLYGAGYEEGIDIPDDARDLPIAIPVASQIPHAVGIAYASKCKDDDAVVLVYFGDGATSEGDFHEALNFAGVWQAPVIFLCQNNRYAISLPRHKQSRSETLAQKAIAYGMPGLQVDGNDILAVYAATRDAVERAREGDGPTLIEALTYRLSVHTTADDPTKYREDEEVERWEKRDPILRFRHYLIDKGLMSEEDHEEWLEEATSEVRAAVERFEERLGPEPLEMFEHAYAEMPPYLEAQRQELKETLEERGSLSEEEPGEGPEAEEEEAGETPYGEEKKEPEQAEKEPEQAEKEPEEAEKEPEQAEKEPEEAEKEPEQAEKAEKEPDGKPEDVAA